MDHLRRYAPIVDDIDAFLEACRRPLAHTVRVQTTNVEVDRVVSAFDASDVEATPRPWSDTILELDTDTPGRTLPAYLGWVHGQEIVSCLPAPLLDISPGDRVWDACGAPGSKSGHIVDLLGDEGLVVSTDDNLGRLSALRFNLERLGATCVAVDHADARRFDPSELGVETFDATLVDAPCSGEGTVRKNPDVLDDWSVDHIESISAVQRGILGRAIELTEPGGRVIYSTCTFAPEENEAVVDSVLQDDSCEIEAIDLPIDSVPGITEWQGTRYDDRLESARRVYPHLSDTGGFFIAALRVCA